MADDEPLAPTGVPDLAGSIIGADEQRARRLAAFPSPHPVTSAELAAAGYWFGPRSGRLGWGWKPVSWKGWLVVILFVGAAFVAEIAGRDERTDALYAIPLTIVLIAICVLKGTAPGPSKRARRQLAEVALSRPQPSNGDQQ